MCVQIGVASENYLACLAHSTRNGPSTLASVFSGPYCQSRIASAISGASNVRRRMQVM